MISLQKDGSYRLVLKDYPEENLKAFADESIRSVFIPGYMPLGFQNWTKHKFPMDSRMNELEVFARNLRMEVQLDRADFLKHFEILSKGSTSPAFYFFERPLPDTLQFESLPRGKEFQILSHNGLKLLVFIQFEFTEIFASKREKLDELVVKHGLKPYFLAPEAAE